VAVIAMLVVAGAAIQGAGPARRMVESATLPIDKNVLKRLGAISDYLSDKRYAEAIEVLQEIAQSDGRLLVEAQAGTPSTSAAYVNVATRCNILLSQLPPEGLAIYRRKVDAQARRWLDQWNQSRDEADLLRIVRGAYLSSVGDEALWALGEAAWDRGDYSTARLYWTQLIPLGSDLSAAELPTILRYPDADQNRDAVLARLVLCSLMEGDRPRAAAELDRFRQLAPDAEGTLAGRQGRLTELVQQLLDESIAWELTQAEDAIPTFALNPQRGGILPDRLELGASKWSHPLPPGRVTAPDPPNALLDRGPLSYHPVTYGDLVFVNNARSIWAWNLLTGEPAWPTERGTAEIYPPAPDSATGIPHSPCVGVPHFTMTVADGRLYARMGSVVTNPAEGPSETELSDSDLICLDLETGQGKLVWKRSAQELFPDAPRPWRFEGSPLVMNGRAYVALSRRRPGLEFSVACLDAATGGLLWMRDAGTSRGFVEDHQNRVSHLLLTAGGGKLYLATDAGAILALSARDGRLEWAVTYESLTPSRNLNFSNHLQQGLLPPLFHEGLLFVAPNDCSRLFCIEADSGRVRWQLRHPDPDRWRHLLGVVPGGTQGRLIVSGRALWSIDIETHEVVYGRPNGPRNLASVEQGYGRGVLVDNVILFPVREAIQVVDAATGMRIEEKSLQFGPAPETGGNLVACRGMLLIAQPERLVAYCEYSVLKKRLEQELSERLRSREDPSRNASPGDWPRLASLYWQLSDLEYAEGNLGAAIQVLRDGLQRGTALGAESSGRFPTRIVELLRQASRLARADGNTTLAIEQLQQARAYAQREADHIAVLLDLADAEASRGRAEEALATWQEILDQPELRTLPVRDSTAGEVATSLISQVIQSQGRSTYTRIEQRAEQAIQAAGNRESDLRQVLLQFPHSTAVLQAWCRLAESARDAGNPHQALEIYSRLRGREDSTVLPDEVLVSQARTLESAAYWRSAAKLWKQLAMHDATAELALKHLQHLEPLTTPPERDVGFLELAWHVPLAGERVAAARATRVPAVLAPEGTPPSGALACRLARRPEPDSGIWQCVDRASGQIRWSRSFPRPPQWCGYAESHLLIATATQLHAVTLESGGDLWTITWPDTGPTDERQIVAEPLSHVISAREPARELPLRIALRGPWLLLFDVQSGLTALQTSTGQQAWNFTPSRGRLQWNWGCQEKIVALQTLEPAATWLISLEARQRSSEREGAADPWLGPPHLSDETTVLMMADRHVECRSTLTGWIQWTYQGGMSFVYTDPVLWSAGDHLLLTVDGTTLCRINRTNGRADWSAGIAVRPLSDPRNQVISTDQAAFAASQGLLRRISLSNGSCDWERYLGSVAEQWRVSSDGRTLAAWPVDRGENPSRDSVVLCDVRTGRLIQRIPVPAESSITDVTWDEHGCLITGADRLAAYHTRSDAAVVATGNP